MSLLNLRYHVKSGGQEEGGRGEAVPPWGGLTPFYKLVFMFSRHFFTLFCYTRLSTPWGGMHLDCLPKMLPSRGICTQKPGLKGKRFKAYSNT